MGSARRYRCQHCGERVIVLPRARDGVAMELYDRDFVTSDLPPGDRWALAKHRGVESIDGLLRPPAQCLVSHPCGSRPSRRPVRVAAVSTDQALFPLAE